MRDTKYLKVGDGDDSSFEHLFFGHGTLLFGTLGWVETRRRDRERVTERRERNE